MATGDKLGGGGEFGNSDSTLHSNDTSASTTRALGTLNTAPVNAPQISDALGFAQNQFMKSNGDDAANAGANLRTYGDRALGTLASGANVAQGIAGGQYLNSNPANTMLQPIANGSADGRWSNPYADAAFNQGASQIEGRMRGAFGGSDARPGGGLEQGALANGLGNFATGIYFPTAQQERQNQIGAINQIGQNYGNERVLQNQATGMLPGFASGMAAVPGAQLAGAEMPLDQYIKSLSQVSPGTNISSTKDSTTTAAGTRDATGSSSEDKMKANVGLK